jgi:dTDP-4-amino-4,6-dideoxygalactose transaminase
MRARDIETTLGTYALHCQPFFQNNYDYSCGDLPNSQNLFRQTLTLPLYPTMDDPDLSRVESSLAEAIDEIKR